MRKLILIPLIVLISISCANRVPVSVALPLPPALELPSINVTELQCLSPEAYARLVNRDIVQTERRATLRSIIETTHQ